MSVVDLPSRERVDEAADEGPEGWSNEGSTSEDGHRKQKLLRDEQVHYSPGSDTEECTSCNTVKKSRDQERLNVLRNGAWNQPDQEKYCRGDVYWPPSIELTSKSVSGEATAKG